MSKFPIQSQFGVDVFSLDTMKRSLSPETIVLLEKTIHDGEMLDRSVAPEVATVMLEWAAEKGATHFTHWFQPLTGTTAEKHESFLKVTADHQASMHFSATELTLGEPDASSFPSGGLRATFEARGYTGWDPTSPAFIIRGKNRATLCIPSIFLGYHSEALDKKTPLLRSIRALSKQIQRVEVLIGGLEIDQEKKGRRGSPYATLGTEQEYFLIDKKYFDKRPDLVETGRTLFGSMPAKHQQQEDHYFGSIQSRVIAFMEELDEQLWALGIPAKTRHNEVAPAQYELAPIFEEMNLAVDHNMLTMDVMRRIAKKNNLVVLLHEKPFAGINGSGKHNNWSVVGSDGSNWLDPGEDPENNAKFLTLLCAFIQGVDQYQDLLHFSIASASNEHRLGGNEAPPPIMSIFLGERLKEILEQIGSGKQRTKNSSDSEASPDYLQVGVDRMPNLKRDTADRNRTSPIAFTGAKFEFRAVGSSMNPAGPNIILNTIIADALDSIATKLEKVRGGNPTSDSNADAMKSNFTPIPVPQDLQEILRESLRNHERIIFNGNNYSAEWLEESKRRSLSTYRNTAEALQVLKSEKSFSLFEKHKILSRKEQHSRFEVYLGRYFAEIDIERQCALRIVRSMIVPACIRYLNELANCRSEPQKKVYTKISGTLDKALESAEELSKLSDVGTELERVQNQMSNLRSHVDALEQWIPPDYWSLPSYEKMLLQNV